MTRPLLLFSAFAVILAAQPAKKTPAPTIRARPQTYSEVPKHATNVYSLVHPVTNFDNTPMVMTVQIPASGGYDAQFDNVSVSMPGTGPCLVTIERDGSVATSTAVAIARNNPGVMTLAASHLEGFAASNSTGGTVVARHYLLLGGPVTIKISKQWLANPTGSGDRTSYTARQNLTVRTCALSGFASGDIDWEETRP